MTGQEITAEIKELLGDSSRKGIDMVVELVGDNRELFEKFLDIALGDAGSYSMRASRVVNFATLHHPRLFAPHVKAIVEMLPAITNDSVKREMIKTLSDHSFEMDEETTSHLLELCFRWFTDQNEKIAIQAYSLDILYQISGQYPDLKFELISVIEQQRPYLSSGMKVRIRKMLPKLIRETSQL